MNILGIVWTVSIVLAMIVVPHARWDSRKTVIPVECSSTVAGAIAPTCAITESNDIGG